MKNHSILKWTLIIAIVVVLNLLFNVTLDLVFTRPEYQKFCPEPQVVTQPDSAAACLAQGGQWNQSEKVVPLSPDSRVQPPPPGYCDLQFSCRQQFDTANTVYSRNSFILLVVLGALSLVIGFFLAGVGAVALGLSLGGVLSLMIASIRYWSYMQEYWRFVVLAIALAALIWLGVKKLKE